MLDATRLMQEKPFLQEPFSDKADFFSFTEDEEQPFKVDDSQANRTLGLIGKTLRTYEIGKLQVMGFSQKSIYALLQQNTGGIEFADAV